MVIWLVLTFVIFVPLFIGIIFLILSILYWRRIKLQEIKIAEELHKNEENEKLRKNGDYKINKELFFPEKKQVDDWERWIKNQQFAGKAQEYEESRIRKRRYKKFVEPEISEQELFSLRKKFGQKLVSVKQARRRRNEKWRERETGWIDLKQKINYEVWKLIDKKSGIYVIWNKTKNKYYVGQSENIYKRLFNQHFKIKKQNYDIKIIGPKKIELYKDWYEDKDEFALKYYFFNKKQLDDKESIYIDKYDALLNGYNKAMPMYMNWYEDNDKWLKLQEKYIAEEERIELNRKVAAKLKEITEKEKSDLN